MKYCCENCFNNEYIKEYIRKNGSIGNCEYCGEEDVAIISTEEIGEYIRSCIPKAYEKLDDGTGAYYDSEEKDYFNKNGDLATRYSIKDILEGEGVLDYSSNEELIVDMFVDSGPSIRDIQKGEEDPYDNLDSDDFVIKNDLHGLYDLDIYSIWDTFKFLVKHYNRFFDVDDISGKVDVRKHLLEELRPMLLEYESTIKAGEVFYRARKREGMDFDTLIIDKELSPAPPSVPQINRMSPAGISYLYLSSDENTACKECRYNNEIVIIAKYISKQELSILDFSKKAYIGPDSIFNEEYNHDSCWANEFLSKFVDEISNPVDQNNEAKKAYDYVATQVVAEYIRALGYDGIGFKSSIGNGCSYCFFCGPDIKYFKKEYGIYDENMYYQLSPSFLEFFEIESIALCVTTTNGLVECSIKQRNNNQSEDELIGKE